MNTATKMFLASVSLLSLRMVAFDTGGAGWKKDADGKLASDDKGNPIWIDANGGERALGGDTVNRLNGEAAQLRRERDDARTALEPFKDLDAGKAREAIDKLTKIDQKKLIDSGEVDRVKEEFGKQYTAQIVERDKTIGELQAQRDGLIKSNAFAQSAFIRERIAVPPDMFTATFGGNFKVEDGKVIAYDQHNNKIMSEKRFGEPADIDEAFTTLVNNHPHKDTILRATDHKGTGGQGGGGGRGGVRTMLRRDFDKLGPADSADAAAKMQTGELTIVDG